MFGEAFVVFYKTMDPLEEIKYQIEAGDQAHARQNLITILRTDRHNVEAWILLAPLLNDKQKQTECYKRVLRLDPSHTEARARLSSLTHPQADTVQHDPDLEKFIVGQISGHANLDDTIFEVCQRSGMDWPTAKKFVERVAAKNQNTIAKRQTPLYLFLSIGIILIGILTIYAGVTRIIDTFKMLKRTSDAMLLTLVMRNLRYYIAMFIVPVAGLAMITGGLAGLVKTTRALKEE